MSLLWHPKLTMYISIPFAVAVTGPLINACMPAMLLKFLVHSCTFPTNFRSSLAWQDVQKLRTEMKRREETLPPGNEFFYALVLIQHRHHWKLESLANTSHVYAVQLIVNLEQIFWVSHGNHESTTWKTLLPQFSAPMLYNRWDVDVL